MMQAWCSHIRNTYHLRTDWKSKSNSDEIISPRRKQSNMGRAEGPAGARMWQVKIWPILRRIWRNTEALTLVFTDANCLVMVIRRTSKTKSIGKMPRTTSLFLKTLLSCKCSKTINGGPRMTRCYFQTSLLSSAQESIRSKLVMYHFHAKEKWQKK